MKRIFQFFIRFYRVVFNWILSRKKAYRTLTLLLRARTLLKRGWNPKDYIANGLGERVSIGHKHAFYFCIMGAIHQARFEQNNHLNNPFELLRSLLGGMSPVVWQLAANRKQSEVISLFNKAILTSIFK